MIKHKLNFYLKWTATIVTLIGAGYTSLRIFPINIYLLNVGAALFLLWSIRINERSLIVVNTGLLVIYAMGLWVNK